MKNQNLLWLFAFTALLGVASIFSCRRDPVPPPPPSPVPDLPPVAVDSTPKPPVDTVSYIQSLEEIYVQSNPATRRPNRTYTFYYDAQNRVTAVGIKNYSPVFFDSATTQIFYNGASAKPSFIITPNTGASSTASIQYDTTYFSYDGQGRLIKDSGYVWGNLTSVTKKYPATRLYFYPDSNTTYVHWYQAVYSDERVILARQDTIRTTPNKWPSKLKTFYNLPSAFGPCYSLAEGFVFDTLVNPLAKLNIGGMPFSYIYTPTIKEVLGNSWHKAVWNSNILPYYLDFFSPVLPKLFYLGGFTGGGFLISAQYDAMTVRITPWSKRTKYPAEISVEGSTSLGDMFVYKYHYR